MRHARWFACVLLAALVCTVGLYSIQSCSGHETLTAELGCPVCHAVAHSALQVYLPKFQPQSVSRLVSFLAYAPLHPAAPAHVNLLPYQSRAPPRA